MTQTDKPSVAVCGLTIKKNNMATFYEKCGPTYSVNMQVRTFDKDKNKFINGTVTEVCDELIVVQWEDLNEDTEYEIQKITLEGDILFT